MKLWKYTLFLLICLTILTGCSTGKKGTEETENTYQIYYLNSTMTKLEPQDYIMPAQAEDYSLSASDWEITNLLEQLRKVPKDLDRQAAVPDRVVFDKYKLEDNVLYLYFDSNYSLMNSTREILCRAALVRTLTQVEGVAYVMVYTAEQPIMDTTGIPVGPMANADFIDNISNINSFEKTDLILYFADETGEKLVQEQRSVVHNVNTSMGKLVIDQLIAGPTRPGINPTLPKETKLLNITVKDSVCYLNFDSEFLDNSLDVADYIPIYSIVNSLASVSSINKVQIAVNGSHEVMFWDSISLNQLFERNLDYNVENEEAISDFGGDLP